MNGTLIKRFPAAHRVWYSQQIQDLNKPYPYIGSPAAEHTAGESRRGYKVDKDSEPPASAQLFIFGSITVFMIYFFILREENDIDETLYRGFDEVATELELELVDLRRKFMHNNAKNLSNDDVIKRVKQLNVPLSRLFPEETLAPHEVEMKRLGLLKK